MTPLTFYRRRAGFTLIELLTVLFIIAALAAITVVVARSNVADSYKTVGGSDRLSGWLLIAKNKALRDKVPVGIRLIRDPNNPYVCREVQYVEMPVLWAPNQNPDGYTLGNPVPPGTTPPPFLVVRYDQGATGLRQEDSVPTAASNYGVFVFGLDITAFDVKVNDLVRIPELGSIHRIDGIIPLSQAPTWYPAGLPANLYPNFSPTFPCFKLILGRSTIQMRAGETYPPSPPNPPMLLPADGTRGAPGAGPNTGDVYPVEYPPLGAANFFRTFYFGFFRAARPILGEPTVTLPLGMVVDMTPDRLEGAGAYPRYICPSAGLPAINPYENNPLASNAPVPALPDVDIIFAPSGQVLFTDRGLVCFWLRNETKNQNLNLPLGGTPLRLMVDPATNPRYLCFDRARMSAGGESLIVAIYTKSGGIGTFQVYTPNPPNGALPAPANVNSFYDTFIGESMYKFVKDGFNRGL